MSPWLRRSPVSMGQATLFCDRSYFFYFAYDAFCYTQVRADPCLVTMVVQDIVPSADLSVTVSRVTVDVSVNIQVKQTETYGPLILLNINTRILWVGLSQGTANLQIILEMSEFRFAGSVLVQSWVGSIIITRRSRTDFLIKVHVVPFFILLRLKLP